MVYLHIALYLLSFAAHLSRIFHSHDACNATALS